MAKYLFKRILHSIVTLCVVICIVFVLLRQMPIEGYFNNYDKMSEAAVQVSLQKMGRTAEYSVGSDAAKGGTRSGVSPCSCRAGDQKSISRS